ncbi:MAG: hypothetical protein ACJ8AW_28830, partial [Rhodopila sp.]
LEAEQDAPAGVDVDRPEVPQIALQLVQANAVESGQCLELEAMLICRSRRWAIATSMPENLDLPCSTNCRVAEPLIERIMCIPVRPDDAGRRLRNGLRPREKSNTPSVLHQV